VVYPELADRSGAWNLWHDLGYSNQDQEMRLLIGIVKSILLFGSLGSAMLLSYIGHHDRWVIGLTLFGAGYEYYLCVTSPGWREAYGRRQDKEATSVEDVYS